MPTVDESGPLNRADEDAFRRQTHIERLLRSRGIDPDQALNPQPAPPTESWTDMAGRYGSRAGEILGEFGHSALQLPTLLGKLPANVEEYLGHPPDPISSTLREGSRWLEGKSQHALDYMRAGVQEHGGTPLQDIKVDTHVPLLNEVSLATPLRFLGGVAAPAPGLPAIPKLLSRAAVGPALEGMGKLGTYGAGISAAQELDRPPDERDWMNIPKGAALALTAPLLQRGMAIGRGGHSLPPGAERPPGEMVPPPSDMPHGGLMIPKGLDLNELPRAPFNNEGGSYGDLLNVPSEAATSPSAAMPQVPRNLYEGLQENTHSEYGAAAKDELPVIQPSVLPAREAEMGTVPRMRESAIPETPSRLQQATPHRMDVQGMSPETAPKYVGNTTGSESVRNVEQSGPGSTAPSETLPPRLSYPDVDPGVQAEASGTTKALKGALDTLKGERGSVTLGKDLGLIEKTFVLPQHLAQSHPEFKPFYDQLTEKSATAHTLGYTPRKIGEPYLSLPEADRKVVDTLLIQRRMTQQNMAIPPKYQPAVDAVDKMMDHIYQTRNAVLANAGLPAVPKEPYYVPLSRSGDILTIMEGTGGIPRSVSASRTLREGEAVEHGYQQAYPGAQTRTIERIGPKGEEPALNFETLHDLLKAKIINQTEYQQAIQQFGLPPGHAAHFQKAARTPGASTDLLPVIERYIDDSANYMAKFQHDSQINDAINQIPSERIRNYARDLFHYTQERPEEYGRIKGTAAKFALGLNVGSALINKTQPTWMGLPILQRELGSFGKASSTLRWAYKEATHPSAASQQMIDLAEKRGKLSPINAEELFGESTVQPSGIEFGARRVQRMQEAGTLSPPVAKAARSVTDALSNVADTTYQGIQRADKWAGKKFGMKTPLTMGIYGIIETHNRTVSILAGYKAGMDKGLTGDALLHYAEKMSEDINFNYGRENRPPAWRGARAPLGLFTIYPTGALTTQKRLFGDAVANAIKGNFSKVGAATTAAGLYWAIAGARGVPGVDLLNKTGIGPFDPGFLHDAKGDTWKDFAADTNWYGPASQLTGLNISSRASITPQVPIDLETGQFDPGSLAAVRPIAGAIKGMHRFMGDPSLESAYKGLEDAAPPALAAPLTAARWGVEGNVGSKQDHPYLDAEGKPAFYHPNLAELGAKAFGFNPLGLQKARDRAEIAARTSKEFKDETRPMRLQVERHLEANGLTVGSDALREFQRLHQDSYRDTMRAYREWVASGKQGKIEQYYQTHVATTQSKSLANATKKHELVAP